MDCRSGIFFVLDVYQSAGKATRLVLDRSVDGKCHGRLLAFCSTIDINDKNRKRSTLKYGAVRLR